MPVEGTGGGISASVQRVSQKLLLNAMTKSKKVLDSKVSEIELHPDAWERFERAVDSVIKSGPMHRTAKERPASKGRVHKGKSRA